VRLMAKWRSSMASRGIGRGIADRLAHEGARVAMTARGAEGAARRATEKIKAPAAMSKRFQVTLASTDDVEGHVQSALDRHVGHGRHSSSTRGWGLTPRPTSGNG